MRKLLNILLAEDNPGDVLLIEEALQEAELEPQVSVVNNGVDVLDYLRRQGRFGQAPPVDLLIMDLNLPAKNGREILAELSADGTLNHLPVAVLTSSTTDGDMCRLYPANRCVYHTKPASFRDLVGVLRQIEQFWLQSA